VLLSPENVRGYCLGQIGLDRVCLLQTGLCDVAKHEKQKLEIREAMVHIMAPATKQTKFADYEAPPLAVVNLSEKQYAELTQEQHPVNDWNKIILAIKAGKFENEFEYEEVKQRASKKSVFIQAFTPRKKVKFGLEVLDPGVQEVRMEASAEVQILLKPRRPVMEGAAHAPKGKEWEALCTYVQMLNTKLPELQEIMAHSEEALTDRLLGVEDELGATLAELGTGYGVPGGGYVNVWSGVGSALEKNQAVAAIVSKLAHQVKLNVTALEMANQANLESGQLKTQFVGLYQRQKAEEMKVTQLGCQFYQLTMLLNQMQQEQQRNVRVSNLNGPNLSGHAPVMANGVPVEDAVEQLQLQLQMVQSRLRSDAASVAGHVFESYEDTYQWVVANCSPEGWQYVMDMPALYSLVRPDGQEYDVMLTEESNSSKAGYASSAQDRLSLSFKTKFPGIFGADRSARNGHPFSAILEYIKWESTGIKRGFRDQV
jgi:hypothetical protein